MFNLPLTTPVTPPAPEKTTTPPAEDDVEEIIEGACECEEGEEDVEVSEDQPDKETPAAPEAAKPVEEKKPEGIEKDPYEWEKCSIACIIQWLPDGTVALGVRNHLDAPIITLLTGDQATKLPGHAAELPIPTQEAIANLLAQLRDDLPNRAAAKAAREEETRKKAEEEKARREANKKKTPAVKPASTVARQEAKAAAKLTKNPTAPQISLFDLMMGGK